jgi:hypothetical protein
LILSAGPAAQGDPYRLGPYRVTTRERVVASLLISFRTGHWAVRLWSAMMVLMFGGLALWSLWIAHPALAGVALFMLLFTFVIRPALHQLWRSRGATVSLTDEGFVSDAAKGCLLLRWPALRSAHYVGGYLIVMISRGYGIIVPPSAAPAERLREFAEELERRRTAG